MESTTKSGELVRVEWNGDDRTWFVYARESVDESWSVYQGDEDELDELLSIARDVVTGG